MPANRGVKKNHFPDADRQRDLPHGDYRHRKARRAAELAMNAFDTPSWSTGALKIEANIASVVWDTTARAIDGPHRLLHRSSVSD
jgi:hypothetical protein